MHTAVQLRQTHTAELARKACRGTSALIVCLSAVAVLVAACETSSSISAGPDPLKCQLSLAAPPMIDAGGGTGTLTVTTNPECAWTATSGAPWISLSPSSGQGSATVELRVTPNEGSTQRDGNITVNSEQVRVSQRAPCRFELAPVTHRMAAAGGTGRVTVSTLSDCAWTATSDVTWIALATPVSGAGNGAVTFTVEPNGDNDRIGNIVIGGQRSTVMQAAVVAPPTPPTPAAADAADADAADSTGPVAILQLRHFTGRSERRRSRRCRLGRRLYTSRLRLGCSEQCVVDHRDVGIERGWKRLGGVHGRRQHRRGAHWQPDHCRSRVHRHPGGLRVHPVEDARANACERGLLRPWASRRRRAHARGRPPATARG